jgi:hypothetical protein
MGRRLRRFPTFPPLGGSGKREIGVNPFPTTFPTIIQKRELDHDPDLPPTYQTGAKAMP